MLAICKDLKKLNKKISASISKDVKTSFIKELCRQKSSYFPPKHVATGNPVNFVSLPLQVTFIFNQ